MPAPKTEEDKVAEQKRLKKESAREIDRYQAIRITVEAVLKQYPRQPK